MQTEYIKTIFGMVDKKYYGKVFQNYLYWADQYHLAINDMRLK